MARPARGLLAAGRAGHTLAVTKGVRDRNGNAMSAGYSAAFAVTGAQSTVHLPVIIAR